ncbi:MAG: sigma-70 family RNA polymerase sigma factor [Planctomycetota bacterium]|nr:MAG: sigma-70 family RNA polymerase sigma factor [Planctomycetota bacterium]
MATDGTEKIPPQTVADWYIRYGESVYAFLLGMLRSPELATEALQNTFAKALESGHRVRSQTVRGWLFRTAYHEACLLRRKQRRDARHHERAAWELNGRKGGADEFAPRWDEVELVRRAVRRLPPEQQIVIEKRFYTGQTFQQIADELGLPLGTVLTRCRIALRELRKALKRLNDDEAEPDAAKPTRE